MGTIQIKNLSFRYDGQTKWLFDHFSLSLDESWKLGLIGRNGRGKTTFLNLLLGKYAYHGTIQSNVRFNYFPQPVIDPTQNMAMLLTSLAALDMTDIWKLEVEMAKLNLDEACLDRPFSTLSPGERTKALLAALFTNDTTFQLIDEPTNHLDLPGRQTVADYLRKKTGFIVVSHDRDFINQITDHVLSIDRAKIQLFHGNYDTWQQEFDHKNQFEAERKKHLKSEIARLKTAADQTKHWADITEAKMSQKSYHDQHHHVKIDKGFLSHKSAKMMKRSQSTLKRVDSSIEEKKGLLKNLDHSDPLTMAVQPPHQSHLLTVNDLQVRRGQKILNAPITFDLKSGQCLVLEGANGLGKTTLIKAILGETSLIAHGHYWLNSSINVSYLSQDFETLNGSLDAYADQAKIVRSDLLNMLHKLGLPRSAFVQPLEALSMGQKRKILLAKALCEPASLYIWDEPLNYLDVITRRQLQELILDQKPTMLIIDHDKAFVDAIATQKIWLTKAESN